MAEMRECEECGCEFEPGYDDQTYCSDKCAGVDEDCTDAACPRGWDHV